MALNLTPKVKIKRSPGEPFVWKITVRLTERDFQAYGETSPRATAYLIMLTIYETIQEFTSPSSTMKLFGYEEEMKEFEI